MAIQERPKKKGEQVKTWKKGIYGKNKGDRVKESQCQIVLGWGKAINKISVTGCRGRYSFSVDEGIFTEILVQEVWRGTVVLFICFVLSCVLGLK